MSEQKSVILRFGVFELDTGAQELRKNGLKIRLPPKPFKLLLLLINSAGRVITRDEIRAALWTGDTFVDFDQGVNFAIKQVREALDDVADRSLYIQTVPKRGYRFVAPVESLTSIEGQQSAEPSDLTLHKALWANIVELRLAEETRRKRTRIATVAVAILVIALAAFLLVRMP